MIAVLLAMAALAGPWQPTVGVHLGATVSLGDLSTSVMPRIEIGHPIRTIHPRLHLLALGAYTAPSMDGSGVDSRLPEGGAYYTWVRHQELLAGLGVAWFGDLEEHRVAPELSFTPVRSWQQTVVEGYAAGAWFGPVVERQRSVGVVATLGLAVSVGRGALSPQVGAYSTRLDGKLTGPAANHGLLPSIGYRVSF